MKTLLGTRILTEAEITALSDNSLKRYRRAVLAKQEIAHSATKVWCCEPKSKHCVVVKVREVNEKQLENIKTFDHISAACKREIAKRDREKDILAARR